MAELEGNTELLRRLADLHFSNTPTLVHRLRAGLRAQAVEEVERPAHALKSSLAQFMAHGAATRARKLEEAARRRDLPGAGALLDELERDLAEFDADLKEFLKQL